MRYGRAIYHPLAKENDRMAEQPNPEAEFRALQAVIAALQPLAPEARARISAAAATFLEIGLPSTAQPPAAGATPSSRPDSTYPAFGEDTAMTAKEFMVAKQPRSDVERIAVLAYYLTHYRDLPHFKTLDLSKLNTEAAQPKFSNAANSANNAMKQGYLAAATKGLRQLSAAGEQFVNALPDHSAARLAMSAAQTRRRTRRQPSKKAPERQA
jgi:hypothetical protein